jgi:hypothetical protein
LLFPFFFDRGKLDEALAALTELRLGGASPTSKWAQTPVWATATPRDLYKDELLPHVEKLIFSEGGGATPGFVCRHLCVNNAIASSLFRNAEAVLSDASGIGRVPVILDGIELWLTSFGVGILSISLHPKAPESPLGLAAAIAVDHNYRLCRMPPRDCPTIHLLHRSEQPGYDQLPPATRQAIPPVPNADAPLSQRIGVAGGAFALHELIAELLLKPLDSLHPKHVQPSLSVFTVARFGASELDLDRPDVRTWAGRLLAALAQVEEAHHAGVPAGTLPVANAILNRRHWAAAGQLGAAHLIGDQPAAEFHRGTGLEADASGAGCPSPAKGEHPFNAQRMQRVFYKYFTPYLIAQIQRLVLHRILSEAGQIARSPTQAISYGQAQTNPGQTLAQLRAELLAFGVGGHFTQISSRDSVHRFYRVCRDGLDVPAAWEGVRQAVSDLEASYTTGRQEAQAAAMSANLTIIAHVQTMVEYIECFLVSVYAAELVHNVFEAQKGHGEQVSSTFVVVHTSSILVAAVLGFVATYLTLRPSRYRISNPKDNTRNTR